MKSKNTGAYVLLVLAALKLIVDAALVVAICGLLCLFGLQFPHSAKMDSLWLVQKLHLWGDPALGAVTAKFGWNWPAPGISFLPIGGGFAVLAVKIGWDFVMLRLTRLVRKLLPLPKKSLELSTSASSQGISVSSTLLALAAVSDKAMAKLQRRYARVERKLEATKPRWCAFLSVGVVDAEGMKLGADGDKVARSFKAYEEMLEGIFRDTGTWKEAWTPENVMVCYREVANALEAAQCLLKGLGDFNARRNELSRPFQVCCGINEGNVVIFEDSKLQKVADRVIDVAGHMQKKARPNTLWLSAEVYGRLKQKPGFHPARAQVDGFEVFEWSTGQASSAKLKPVSAA